VQLGQRVGPGLTLMAIVPLDQVWVDANFKEPQLAMMRVGQPVTLSADLYGHSVVYHGTVAGFGAGSVFSLLPAQNATGNWIKIIQRVPVRVALNGRELARHPLQIGLSMRAEVDTRDRNGPRLPQISRWESGYATDVFGAHDSLAERRVHAIIIANEAGRAAASVPSDGRLAHLPAPAASAPL
jgi:membrane fusion protein (multidrug efflux system)